MTKYDFRVRRNLFQRRGSDKFQNFEELQQRYKAQRRANNIIKIVMVLIAVVLLIGVFVYSAHAENIYQQKTNHHSTNVEKTHIYKVEISPNDAN